MSAGSSVWAATELAEFVARLSALDDPELVLKVAAEAAAQAFDAEVAAVVTGDRVAASLGWPAGRTPVADLLACVQAVHPEIDVPGGGSTPATVVSLGNDGDALLVARRDQPLSPFEAGLLAAMAHTTRMAYGSAKLIVSERRARVAAQDEARENARLLDALVEASAAKDDFVSVTSHELRTPLTSIVGFAQTLRRHNDTISAEERDRYLGVIERQATRLTRLVGDLLDVSRIESADFPVEAQDVNLAKLLHRVVEESFPTEGDTIRLRVAADVTACVDPDHLDRVVVNLVENALKYGRPPVDVTARVEGDRVALRVRDHGEGVPEDFRDEMFEKFSQASRGDQRGATGTGLGLSIVRGLVRANGGEVGHRPMDPGACFVVWLPLAQPI